MLTFRNQEKQSVLEWAEDNFYFDHMMHKKNFEGKWQGNGSVSFGSRYHDILHAIRHFCASDTR